MLYTPPTGSTDPRAPYLGKNLAAGQQGSKVPPGAVMNPQLEIENVISASGQTPTNGDLQQLLRSVRSGVLEYAADVGVQNALAIAPTPVHMKYLAGLKFRVRAKFSPTGPATLSVNGLAPQPIVKNGGVALSGGEWVAGDIITLDHNGLGAFQLTSGRTDGNLQLWCQLVAGVYAFQVPPGTAQILAELWGPGGAGGGVSGSSASGAGGGGGGYARGAFLVHPGDIFAVIIGAGAPRTAVGAYSGQSGGTSSFGAGLMSATGGSGGAGAASGFGVGRTAGGMGYGGAVNLPGGVGRSGFASGSTYFGGDGGSSYGSGEIPIVQGGYHDGEMPGQGGAGAGGAGGGGLGGGRGSDGACIIQCVG